MLVVNLLFVGCLMVANASNFNKNFVVSWGDGRGKILNNGKQLAFSLDKGSGSGFHSKNQYLLLSVYMQIKFVPDNSAGTVTTFFLSSLGANHDEIEPTPSPGLGATSYSLSMEHPLFKNMESIDVPFPKSKPMRIFASLWDAEEWATQGGRVKTDWNKAPFLATYGSCNIKGCKWIKGKSSCAPTSSTSTATTSSDNEDVWMDQEMDSTSQDKINWVRANYMIYDYCADKNRFPEGLPLECNAQ